MKKTFGTSRVAAASVLAMTLVSALPAYGEESRCTRALNHAERNLNDRNHRRNSTAAWMARKMLDDFLKGFTADGEQYGLTDADKRDIERYPDMDEKSAVFFKSALVTKLEKYRTKKTWVDCRGKRLNALPGENADGWLKYNPAEQPEDHRAPHTCIKGVDVTTFEDGTVSKVKKLEQPGGAAEIMWMPNLESSGVLEFRVCFASQGSDYYCIQRSLLSGTKAVKADLSPSNNEEIHKLTYNEKSNSWDESGFPVDVIQEHDPARGFIPHISYKDDLAIGESPETYRNRIFRLYRCEPSGQESSIDAKDLNTYGLRYGECKVESFCRAATAAEEAAAQSAQ